MNVFKVFVEITFTRTILFLMTIHDLKHIHTSRTKITHSSCPYLCYFNYVFMSLQYYEWSIAMFSKLQANQVLMNPMCLQQRGANLIHRKFLLYGYITLLVYTQIFIFISWLNFINVNNSFHPSFKKEIFKSNPAMIIILSNNETMSLEQSCMQHYGRNLD